jgi:hypothetical protein
MTARPKPRSAAPTTHDYHAAGTPGTASNPSPQGSGAGDQFNTRFSKLFESLNSEDMRLDRRSTIYVLSWLTFAVALWVAVAMAFLFWTGRMAATGGL